MKELYPAIIAAIVSILGTIVVYITVKWNLKLKVNELQIKETELTFRKIELENLTKKLESDFISLKQTQLTEIIKKRIEVYPLLWEIITKYGTSWVLEKKEYDKNWVNEYIDKLNLCNQKYGIFFSDDVYRSFYLLRHELYKILEKYKNNSVVTQKECEMIYSIIFYGSEGMNNILNVKSLAGSMKDDLGSYSKSIIQEEIIKNATQQSI